MVYQDHLTKFCILQALMSKRAAKVTFHLLDIFVLFGAPVILQSDNGSKFTSQVITELKIQATSDETPTHDLTEDVLLPVKHSSTTTKYTGDNVTSQPTTAEILDLPTGPSLPTATPTPSDSPVSSVENHRVAERIKEIKRLRREAADTQTSQAERMVKRSRVNLRAGEQGDNVAVPVLLVDRGRGHPRNILCVIIDRRKDTHQYRIAVKAGILSGLYSRNRFDLCPQRLLNTDEMNTGKTVSLRSAVISQSASGEQGFTRCICTGIQKCSTRRCKCLKAGLLCNSRCYSSLNCCNK
ncbi:uncharacterized protein [Palaemon carinicauda]|uniref:uncharacterized protein n=1 Tax=Palaemon carinicauda TaxID=392227 RepID=UPI0035B5C841